MSAISFLILVAAGFGAGLTGSIAGLASLVSYPALLAFGIPPLAANVTNTVALLLNGLGTALGARTELRGQGARIRMLSLWAALGGVAGAGLLLAGSSATFQHVVPWLVALGSVLLLGRDWIRSRLSRRQSAADLGDLGAAAADGRAAYTPPGWAGRAVIAVVAVYAGYFGAGAGIIMLAVLSLQTAEPLPVSNAVKSVVTTAANLAAAVVFVIVSPVDWTAAAALGLGALVGGWCGPAIVRVLPAKPLRIAIAIAGLGLAADLLLT